MYTARPVPIAPVKGQPRRDQRLNQEAIENAVGAVLVAVGQNPDRTGLNDTPRRVVRMYEEMFSGLSRNPEIHPHVTFTEEYSEMVLLRDISLTSMCEHHLLPFSDVARLTYIPNGRHTGLSKLAHKLLARSPTSDFVL